MYDKDGEYDAQTSKYILNCNKHLDVFQVSSLFLDLLFAYFEYDKTSAVYINSKFKKVDETIRWPQRYAIASRMD